MTDRELRNLTGGAPTRKLQPLEMDMSLVTELRGRDIGKEPGIKQQAPKGPVVHYGKGTLEEKTRSSSAGMQPSTAEAMKAVQLNVSSKDVLKAGSRVSFDAQPGQTAVGIMRNSVSTGTMQLPSSGGARVSATETAR